MNKLTEYALNTLYPKLQEDGVPIFYPEMDFQKNMGGKWQSRKRMDGTDPSKNRKDKTEIFMRNDRLYIVEHDEQGDLPKDLITHYMDRHPEIKSDGEAIVKMAEALGLTPPALSPEDERNRRQQERLKQFAMSLQEALHSEQGKEALAYLKETRGYSEDLITFAQFGYLSPEGASSLRDLYREMGYSREVIRKQITPEIGAKFVLAIPYEYGGEIWGFVVRSLSSTDRDKYRDILPVEGTKTKCLFSLNARKLRGSKETDRNLNITEGEIDCRRAQHAGIQNVVAASGINKGGVSREALRRAKEKGVKRVTFLFDTDEKPDSTDEALEASIKNAIAEGLKPYVCKLPPRIVEEEKEDENGKKVKVEIRKKEDVDSYLRDHTGEELQRLLDGAESGFWYMYNKLFNEARQWQGDRESLTDEQTDRFMERLSQIVTSPLIPIKVDEDIRRNTEEIFNIKEERLHDYLERQQQKADIERQKSELLKTTQKAEELIKADKVEEAFSLLKRKVPESEAISMEAQYSELLKIPTREDIIRRLKEEPEGIRTQYTFWDRKQKSLKERLTIPAGALTFIGAPTSHGKSRFIENLAIHTATDKGAGGAVLYFSFEEDELSVTLQLLNIFADMSLADNNLRSIGTYYREDSVGFFKNGVSVADFQDRERAFYSNLIESGKLRVYRKEYDSGDLIGAIRHMVKQLEVRAVFIDYAQLLHKRGTRFQRKEELQEICRDLMNLAIETRLPIVLAAQVNRQALSPLEMVVQNIAEASDIEHSANVVVLLWNSIVKPLNGSNHYNSNAEPSSKEAKELQEMGFNIGERGKMYATIAKNRGGLRNVHAVFDFNENTGAIKGDSGASSQEELPFEEQDKEVY